MFSGIQRRYVYDKYIYSGDFPISIALTTQEKQKCQNAALKLTGKFLVVRKIDEDNDITFRAVTKETDEKEMSSMISESGGICDDVVTEKEYQGCGLAKYLVATCFQDEAVLGLNNQGVDVNKNPYWTHSPDQRKDVAKYCETVAHLRCMPLSGAPNAVIVCVSYLRAGSISGFDLLLTVSDSPVAKKTFNVFKLGETLENGFKANADKFIQDNGRVWFYCKCKDNEKENCKKMQS